ncbi:hypothetical protein CEXT_323711 [Caerostris extrusa]|uniref:Uncharacterized protein n=1 Tax=Caerostris extrusa TaxID=172846 RepID=A0AAV4XJM4_CAEEX|nr:hypothetical protein CEXT_323711 [Caerostris extrusa]
MPSLYRGHSFTLSRPLIPSKVANLSLYRGHSFPSNVANPSLLRPFLPSIVDIPFLYCGHSILSIAAILSSIAAMPSL